MSKITDICLDLDGSLNDFFDFAFYKLDKKFPNRITRDQYLENPSFDMAEKFGISTKEFWQTVDGDRFWLKINPLPWAKQLYDFLGRFATVTIASSPSLNPQCIPEKLDWLDKYLGINSSQCLFGGRKYLMAKPTTLLVDDYPENCEKFIAAGGKAVCIPSTWNTKNLQYNDILERIIKEGSLVER